MSNDNIALHTWLLIIALLHTFGWMVVMYGTYYTWQCLHKWVKGLASNHNKPEIVMYGELYLLLYILVYLGQAVHKLVNSNQVFVSYLTYIVCCSVDSALVE